MAIRAFRLDAAQEFSIRLEMLAGMFPPRGGPRSCEVVVKGRADPRPAHQYTTSRRAGCRAAAHCEGQCSGAPFPCQAFSPASIRTGSQFERGGSGQVAKAVKAQGGFVARLKSSTTLPSFGMSA